MQKIIAALVAVALLVGAGYWYFYADTEVSPDDTGMRTATYASNDLGLTFEYRTGASGYSLEEHSPSQGDTTLLRTLVLMSTKDKIDLERNPRPESEGPPVISISVFKNTEKQFPLSWAMEHTQYSTFNLKTSEESQVVVGGANAIAYSADGLYASRNVVVAHGDNVYVITGQFLDTNSDLWRDFQPLVESIRFIPTASSGKIDIAAVCEGALAYMSFPNGAAADAFVADCKEGKHPEVIERYKSDHGLGDGAAL